MQNNFSAADVHDIYAIVLHAAQQSSAAEAKQIIAALLQFSDTGDAYALHTALSKIKTYTGDAYALHTALSKIKTYTGDALQNAMYSVSDYVSVV